MKRKSPISHDLEERGRFWQRALRLQDWFIVFEWQRYHGMDDPSNEANILTQYRHKAARIRIREEQDYPPDAWRPWDLDRLLVHELLHLSLKNVTSDEDTDEEEQFVEVMSTQIVALWRGQIKIP
jgi:hypothetical protein